MQAQETSATIKSQRYKTSEDYLAIDQLKVDYTYHRRYDEKHAKKMLADAGGVYVEEVGRYILVSRRSDGDYVIVGLHRSMMAKLAGEDMIPAVIIHGIAVEQEAELARIESARRKESPVDQFRQELVAGQAEAVAIDRIVRSFGGKIAMADGRSTSGFDAINTVRAIYRRDQGQTLAAALGILKEAYGKVPTDSKLLRGLTDFLADTRHAKVGIDKKRLVASMKRDGLKTHEVMARDLKPLDGPKRIGHFRAFVDAYNHGRRTGRLPQPWK